jgi:hypothetical protein
LLFEHLSNLSVALGLLGKGFELRFPYGETRAGKRLARAMFANSLPSLDFVLYDRPAGRGAISASTANPLAEFRPCSTCSEEMHATFAIWVSQSIGR